MTFQKARKATSEAGSGVVVLASEIVGYARVSTASQVMDVQMQALKNAGCTRIFSETISSGNAKRPQYRLMMKHIEPGDTVVVYSFSRLSRNLKDLLIIVDDFKVRGINLKSTSEPQVEPFKSHGRMMLSMIGTMDEMERNRVKDRTKDAMAEKQRCGMYLGRPRLIELSDIPKMKAMRKAGKKAAEIADKFGIAISTVYANT